MEPKTIKISAGLAIFGAALIIALASGGEDAAPEGAVVEALTQDEQDRVAEKQAARTKLATVTEPALTKESVPRVKPDDYNAAIVPLRKRDPFLVDFLTPALAPGESTAPETFGANFPLGARLQVDAENHLWVDWPSGDALSITGGSCTDKPDEQQTWCGFEVANNTAEARRAVFLVRYEILAI